MSEGLLIRIPPSHCDYNVDILMRNPGDISCFFGGCAIVLMRCHSFFPFDPCLIRRLFHNKSGGLGVCGEEVMHRHARESEFGRKGWGGGGGVMGIAWRLLPASHAYPHPSPLTPHPSPSQHPPSFGMLHSQFTEKVLAS